MPRVCSLATRAYSHERAAMHVSVPVYQGRDGMLLRWCTLGLGVHNIQRTGLSPVRLTQAITDTLRQAVEAATPVEAQIFELVRNTRLERVRLELTLRGDDARRKMTGLFPIVVEPHPAGGENRLLTIAYHPAYPKDWFPVKTGVGLAEQAQAHLQTVWRNLDDDDIAALRTEGRDAIRMLSFTATPKSLLDALPKRQRGVFDDLALDPARGGESPKRGGGLSVLPQLAVNETRRAADGALAKGVPRSPYREQLALLLTGREKRSTIVIGPPGVGKTTLLAGMIHDLLEADEYPTHRNLDRVSEVWGISGKRIIAGMSYVGDWEKRCMEVLADAQKRRIVLWITDISQWGRIGRARGSDRCLADLFRGPIARGEVVFVGEATSEQIARLEEDAPSFAALFTRVFVEPPTPNETFRLLVHEARSLEKTRRVAFSAFALRSVFDIGGAFSGAEAQPGKALGLLNAIARAFEGKREVVEIGSEQVLQTIAERTGLPSSVLRRDTPLAHEAVVKALAGQVMGQDRAVDAVADLVLRVKAGLADPGRPYGVFLFTGPTGTGKTELAKALAVYLYGNAGRLVRLDMGELSGPDAASRLIGDRWTPEGLLTQRLIEQPFSVVLLDEIEKAHPAALYLLLQLFDEGRLTDAGGNVASFLHAVVIMTSNLGSSSTPAVGFGGAVQVERAELDTLAAVRDFFPPELFNRIGAVLPFRPLAREVAAAVVQKELESLLSRRGITQRSLLVRIHQSVVDRIVREAFQTKDGARALKRYLEDSLGSLLTEHIAKTSGKTMQSLRIFERAGADGVRAIVLEAESLDDASPIGGEAVLAPLIDKGAVDLRAEIPALLARLEALAASPAIKRLQDALAEHLARWGDPGGADRVFHLDALQGEVRALHDLVASLLDAPDVAYEALEIERFAFEEIGSSRVRILDRRAIALTGPRAARQTVLVAIAESAFLAGALARADDHEQHAVTFVLSSQARRERVDRFSTPPDPLLSALALGYAHGRGTCEAFAVEHRDGTIVEGRGFAELGPQLPTAERVVLTVVGLAVRETALLERGTHLLARLSAGPSVVRVDVLPPAPDPGELLRRQRAAREAFEAALDRGETADNPEPILPVVRRLAFDPPVAAGTSALAEIEDLRLGTADVVHATRLSAVLERVWLVARSHRPAAVPSASS